MKKNLSKGKDNKNIWQMQEAKAKFSEVIKDANLKGYQIITKQGEPIAVILSKNEFDKIKGSKVSLLNFFKAAPFPETELNIQRSKELSRELDL